MHAELMTIDLGVAALRALAAVLIVSVVWPPPVGAAAVDAPPCGANRDEEGFAMTTFVWTMALGCWSTAALLVAFIIYPDFFQSLDRTPKGHAE